MIDDPRLAFLIKHHPAAPADASAGLHEAARDLADLGKIDPGEASLLLNALASKWGVTINSALFRTLGAWCAHNASIDRAAQVEDELAKHIADQADGTYALAPWPWPILTRESRSLMPGSVTLVCGAPGAAKSWFGLSCVRYWSEHGIESAVLMLEETVKWHLQRALAQCAADPNLLKPEWIAANRSLAESIYHQHKPAIAQVRERLTCDGNRSMAQCAEWVEQQCKAGKRIIIVDPITLADPGGDKPWDADRKFMARAKVAVEQSGASLVLVTHPRKAPNTAKGGAAAPALDDLAGGAAYGRAAASALWVAGVSGTMTATVVDLAGQAIEVTPHKIIRILKTRNGTGPGKGIAYQFRGLAFDELGELGGQVQSEGKTTARRAERAKAKPSDAEDAWK